MNAFRDIIKARLPVTAVPGLSALRLHLANEKSGLGQLLAEADGERPPYWAHLWAGGLALARHIARHPETVRGKRVIDYGTGSGLVAIAAAKAGARMVFACDIDPLALQLADMNAALNSVEIMPHLLTDATLPDADIVLAGDVFYDAETANCSLAILNACRDSGADILIGDPLRPTLPLAALTRLAQYEVPDFASGSATVASAVFTLRQASTACS